MLQKGGACFHRAKVSPHRPVKALHSIARFPQKTAPWTAESSVERYFIQSDLPTKTHGRTAIPAFRSLRPYQPATTFTPIFSAIARIASSDSLLIRSITERARPSLSILRAVVSDHPQRHIRAGGCLVFQTGTRDPNGAPGPCLATSRSTSRSFPSAL